MPSPDGVSPLSTPRTLVVGVDGSPGSLAALRWAAREATSRCLPVHAVTAWQYPPPAPAGEENPAPGRHPAVTAEDLLAAALVEAGVAPDRTPVTTNAIEGHPAEVLMREAQHAELLVVGSRGHGRIFDALLGSVSQYVAARAACPVVVITPSRSARGHGHRFAD